MTTQAFIKRAKEIHGELYDYDFVKYINGKTPVEIICIKCSESFWQTPESHIYQKAGCPICAKEKIGNAKRKTQDEFIQQAIKMHGDLYDYSLVVYINGKTYVTIGCKSCNKPFQQIPDNHLQGIGCPGECKRNKIGDSHRFSLEEFIKNAQLIHGELYDYSLVKYINANTKVIIGCRKCNRTFEQTPASHIHQKAGCGNCNGGIAHDKEKFIAKSVIVHGDLYDYDFVVYLNNHTPVEIICNACCGAFWQTPQNHTDGKSGCPGCNGGHKLTKEQFIEKAREIHKDKYDYSLIKYINGRTDIEIVCRNCNKPFWQRPSHHTSAQAGCPRCCNSSGVSKGEIAWMKQLKIQYPDLIYSEIKKEQYYVEDAKCNVDGFEPAECIAFEYHGNFWHACPDCRALGKFKGVSNEELDKRFNDTKEKKETN
jgi:protein-arginine kinase activator protein McsA